jgi:hypothetical protein
MRSLATATGMPRAQTGRASLVPAANVSEARGVTFGLHRFGAVAAPCWFTDQRRRRAQSNSPSSIGDSSVDEQPVFGAGDSAMTIGSTKIGCGAQTLTSFWARAQKSVASHCVSNTHVSRHVVGWPMRPVQVVPPRQRVTPMVQGPPSLASGGRGSQIRKAPWPATHSWVVRHWASVVHVARQVVAPMGRPVHVVPFSQRLTPGMQGCPAATGGTRATQMRTALEPITHSSVAAHWASVMQVARQVVGPPGTPVHVVPPRHRVTIG